MTYMLLLNCALKLVEEIILYYDARSKKTSNEIYFPKQFELETDCVLSEVRNYVCVVHPIFVLQFPTS